MTDYHVTEYRSNKCIVRVHKPILTVEERKARELVLQFRRDFGRQGIC